MRIDIDGTNIAGASRSESVRQLSVSGGPVVQKIMPLRAAEPRWRTRGNESYAASFEVCRLHESIAAAGIFVWEHPGNVTKIGVVTISEDYDGKRMVRRGNGVVKQIGGCRLIGMSTYIRYDIEIGQVKQPNNL